MLNHTSSIKGIRYWMIIICCCIMLLPEVGVMELLNLVYKKVEIAIKRVKSDTWAP